MTARGVALQGVLALVALLGAYIAWQRPAAAGASEDVVVMEAGRGDVQTLRYEDATRWVELSRRAGSAEAGLWIRHAQKPPPSAAAAVGDAGTPVAKSPDGKTPAGLPPGVTPLAPPPEREVKASESAERLLEQFTPLKAARALGAVPADKLKEMGLEGSPRRLEVVVRGKPHAFRISSSTGPTSPYLQSEADGKVYLLRGGLVNELETASTSLVERRMHLFKPSEVDEVAVSAGNKRRVLAQSASETGQLVKVTSKQSPDKQDEFAKNWLEKIWRLAAGEVLGKGEAPPGGNPEISAKVEYLSKGKSKGFIEVGKPSTGPDAYARTENTVGWVKVYAPEELLKEAQRVADGG
jgi:hypothetical protein